MPQLTLKQFFDLAAYHTIVGMPGVDHADVPLTFLAAGVLNYLRAEHTEEIEPGDLMPHLAPPELDIDEVYSRFEKWKAEIK